LGLHFQSCPQFAPKIGMPLALVRLEGTFYLLSRPDWGWIGEKPVSLVNFCSCFGRFFRFGDGMDEVYRVLLDSDETLPASDAATPLPRMGR
jgi:hypothetical protein